MKHTLRQSSHPQPATLQLSAMPPSLASKFIKSLSKSCCKFPRFQAARDFLMKCHGLPWPSWRCELWNRWSLYLTSPSCLFWGYLFSNNIGSCHCQLLVRLWISPYSSCQCMSLPPKPSHQWLLPSIPQPVMTRNLLPPCSSTIFATTSQSLPRAIQTHPNMSQRD